MDILEIKREMALYRAKVSDIRGYLDLDGLKNDIVKLEEQAFSQGFWDSAREASHITKELTMKKALLQEYYSLESSLDEINVLIEFVETGDNDSEVELIKNVEIIATKIETLELKMLLGGEYDFNNAIVQVHSGAGGQEACDWAEMLERMYLRWCQRNGYKVEILDRQLGDGAGIKSSTLLVKGEYVFGNLKGEKGVHRLVRISPFDANKRRHTSFASIDIMPEIEDSEELEIQAKDIRIDVYRSTGAGGQHVNTTDSAVRITHLPTKIVVTCQNERSQIQNRETAMKVLRSKLIELELKRREEELLKIKGSNASISWGNQIRSYVFQPYMMVKDHRTNYEEGNVDSVMDGKIDKYIFAYLKWKKEES
ncbi:MAG: peptide chain release factor 2 [Fusobacteria bacterium]|nr:peptide chain release factor 2 [Fusobacteriota bacterium]